MVKEKFRSRPIPNQVKQLCEPEQVVRLGAVAIWKPFELWLQNGEPMFMPNEELHEIGAGCSNAVRGR